jgi:hypothetical protein
MDLEHKKADAKHKKADTEHKRAAVKAEAMANLHVLQLLEAQTRADSENKRADAEHKRADMERLLSLDRLHKEGQLTAFEFSQAKSNLLHSPSNEIQGRSLVTTKSSPHALLEDTSSTRFDTNGNALDQILIHLRADVSDLEDTPSPNKSTTEPKRQFDRKPQPMRITKEQS